MWTRLLRRAAVAAALLAAVAVARAGGRLAAALTALGGLSAVAAVAIGLPRAAHRAFRRGDAPRAALYYAVLRRLALDPDVRASADVSLAACDLARGRYASALRRLAAIRPDELPEPARAAWFNDRAYALARSGGDPAAALAAADRAVELRPAAPAFRHTRGIALLAIGRVDEAIRELEAAWHDAEGAPPPLLEAERCYDLGVAWQRKGERDYANDYFDRAQRAAPESTWAERARAALGDAGGAARRAVWPE
ncbi:MAG: hypothetical protein D6689_21450 [Deltaproteobacteria bacterium]|nr:MAG: hypothetical protein D6689_21450 [Deltaproteobacteria bacterium]